MSEHAPIHAEARIGHVHLRVADLERSLAFYRDVLGLGVVVHGPSRGLPGAAFLAAGDYHHHVALNTWQSEGGSAPPAGYTGLHHFALLLPDEHALADMVGRLLEASYPSTAHSTTAAPSRSTCATPTATASSSRTTATRSEWFDDDGEMILKADPFDPQELLYAQPA